MKASDKSIQIRVRCWVEVGGIRFFGPGRADLLQHILDYGSITKAAASMGMSYKKAWASVDEMNSLAKSPYVITSKGGRRGGGAEVTAAGRKAIANFRRLNDKVTSIIQSERALLTI